MKKIKRLCMSLIIMMLTVAMVIGTMSFTASALEVGKVDSYTANIRIESRVKYNGMFNVPDGDGATVTVTAPNGLPAERDENKNVKAEQVGVYTVTYSKKVGETDYSYDFSVYSYVENDYSVSVVNGGADVPTYAKTGDEFTIPAASLVYTDKDGNVVVADSEDVSIKVLTSDKDHPEFAADGTAKYTPASAGNVYLTYVATLGAEGTHSYTKSFVVKVQDDFSDDQRPTLSVVNVATNASINRKVTLPKATATDNYDENVRIEIKVTDPSGNPVKEVDVNEDGYATEKEGAADVKFDNDKAMSFYPTKEGKYTVTYQAFDDGNKNASALHTYGITVSDTTAPVFKSVEEYKIPANWGLSVNDASATIKFPTPVIVDNSGSKENLTLALKVTDSENNTVVNFSNILSADSSYTGTTSSYGTAGTEYKFSEFEFDFNLVNTENKTGDFTVEYAARDSKGNRSTRTYKINVVENYTDEESPSECTIVDAPKYFAVTADVDTFSVPARLASDRGDSRPHIVYTLSSEADEASNVLNLEGGEKLDVVRETVGSAEALYIANEKGEKVKIEGGKNIVLNLTVTDNAGNDPATAEAKIMVFSAASGNSALALDTSDLSLSGDFASKDLANLGGFEINVGDASFRKFTGYELSVKAPDGGLVPEVSSEYYYDTAANKIVVRNVSFTPNSQGVYQVSVRAFDLSGQNIVKVGLINVVKGKDDTTETTAATLTRSGNINTPYSFRNESFTIQGTGTYYPVYRIVGSSHSIMGTEFTALTASSYRISEGYALVDGDVKEMTVKEPYTVNFADDAAPVIEIQGVIPSYSEKDVVVNLPSIVAYSANGNGTVDVTVKLVKGGAVKVDYDETTKTHSFKPTKDGTYTITVTGTLNGKTTSAEYSINVGDVIGPKFELASSHSASAFVGRSFEFSVVNLDSAETIADCTFTKRLIDPSGNVVSEATISGTGKTYADKTKNSNTDVKLTKSGTYEVVYEVSDKVGNTTVKKFSITVSNKTSGSAVSIAAISTVLIVVGVVLIAAVILYFVLFRKRKAKN
ncbi:MAG: hypothetical protein HFK09_07495 [Clostridia bacterium]|nr:hypothetical protein [Clostridia bacterium]